MTKEKRKFQPLTSKSIFEIYNTLHNEGLVSFPLTPDAKNKIDTLVTNINGESFSIPHYPTIEEKVVAHLFFIIKNHAFIDGNKRTAVLTFRVLCVMNSLTQNLEGYNLDSLVIFLERLQEQDHQRIIRIVSEIIFKD